MRHATFACLWITVACIHGCASEANITPGVCGNYVLDPGEDCDQPGSACTSTCRIACMPMPSCASATPPLPIAQCPTPTPLITTEVCASSSAIDGTCCPSGMACGVDAICHAPSGTVNTTAISELFDGINLEVLDVNGDSIADVIGDSQAAILVRYGDTKTPLATLVTASSPEPTPSSTATFVDFEGDGHAGAVIPSRSGLYAFDDATGQPLPVTFPVNGADAVGNVGIITGVTHERMAPVITSGLLVGAVTLDYIASPGSGQAAFQLNELLVPTTVLDVTSVVQFQVADTNAEPCKAHTSSSLGIRGHTLHPFVDVPATGTGSTVRVPYAVGATEICVATANPSATGAGSDYSIGSAMLGSGVSVPGTGETFFANLMEAPGACPDLVIPINTKVGSVTTAGTLILPGSGSTGACSVTTTVPPITIPGEALAPISLAVSGETGLITTNGIFAYLAATGKWTTSAVSAPTRPWTYAIVADVNGDGLDDFAVQTSGPDVEVFRQTSPLVTIDPMTGLPIQLPQWSDFVIPTDDNVATIAFGDFDGDSNEDLAIATTDSSAQVSPLPDDLAIAWGAGTGQFASLPYGTIDEPSALAAMRLADVSLPFGEDVSDSLLLAHGGANTANSNNLADPAIIVAEYGSTSRALASPFVYFSNFAGQAGSATPPNPPPQVLGLGLAAVAGGLGSNAAPGLFAAFQPITGLGSGITVVGGVPASYAGVFLDWDPATATFEASPEATIPAATCSGAPCFPYNAYVSMRRDAGQMELAISVGISRGSACLDYFTFDDSSAPQIQSISCADLAPAAALATPQTDPVSAQAFADLSAIGGEAAVDDDGTTEHIILSSYTGNGDATSNTYEWELTVQDVNGTPTPQLANPVWLNHEMTQNPGLLPATDTLFGCYRAIGIELGTRTVGGITYGADQQEIVVACTVGPPAMGSGSMASGGPSRASVELFARYAGPSGMPPYYELLWNTHQSQTLATLQRGDINGDGLGDIVFAIGLSTAARTLEALVQCDAHGCASGSGSGQ